MRHIGTLLLATLLVAAARPAAALVLLSQWDPPIAGLCSIAVDHLSGDLWVHACSDTQVHRYTPAGAFVAAINRPGEAANDVDIDFTLGPLTVDQTTVPAGTMLFVNGETGVADVHAVDVASGTALDTLATSFGVSHVVGGAHHPGRGTLFLVEDNVPSVPFRNRIAEIHPATGAVINEFSVEGIFNVNYGDLDVCPRTGHLFVVSSVEPRILELRPDGAFVAYHPLPPGPTGVSGLAIGAVGETVWVSGVTGWVWTLGGFPCDPQFADGFESGDTAAWSATEP
jgi:hypothetical protein